MGKSGLATQDQKTHITIYVIHFLNYLPCLKSRGWHSTTACTPSCDRGQDFDQIFYNGIVELYILRDCTFHH